MSSEKNILQNLIDVDGVVVLEIDNNDNKNESHFEPEDFDTALNEHDMNLAMGGADPDEIEGMMTSDTATPNDLIAKRIFKKRQNSSAVDAGDNMGTSAVNTNKLLGSADSSRFGRSPLATVNNNTPQTSESSCSTYGHSSGGSYVRENRCVRATNRLDESFFLYRKRGSNQTEDVFNKLSDEMVLQIFQWLPKKTLIRCTEVCTRFNRLACDEFLWIRMDLGGKTLRNGVLAKIIYRGVVTLRLAQAEVSNL
jgi:F-box and leucine-rich repeat protein 1 (S-phase kinase-associated protein 2)